MDEKLSLKLAKFATVVFGVASFVGIIFTVLVLFLAFWRFIQAIFIMRLWFQTSKEALEYMFQGMEFILLAPLTYLFPRSLSAHFTQIVNEAIANGTADDEAVTKSRTELTSDTENEATTIEARNKTSAELLSTKAMSVSLFVGILATSMVTAASSTAGLELEQSAAYCVAILTLLVYFFGLELMSSHMLRAPEAKNLRKKSK
jgi:hypothetical protein